MILITREKANRRAVVIPSTIFERVAYAHSTEKLAMKFDVMPILNP